MPDRHGIGREAENRAAAYLLGQGYTLVTRRYKARHGEIDLVALEGELLVFVEVKARFAPGYSPEDSLSDAKREALFRAGQQYLIEVAQEPDREVRFDLVAIDAQGLRHYKDILAV